MIAICCKIIWKRKKTLIINQTYNIMKLKNMKSIYYAWVIWSSTLGHLRIKNQSKKSTPIASHVFLLIIPFRLSFLFGKNFSFKILNCINQLGPRKADRTISLTIWLFHISTRKLSIRLVCSEFHNVTPSQNLAFNKLYLSIFFCLKEIFYLTFWWLLKTKMPRGNKNIWENQRRNV